jgi:hypothetical protein
MRAICAVVSVGNMWSGAATAEKADGGFGSVMTTRVSGYSSIALE